MDSLIEQHIQSTIQYAGDLTNTISKTMFGKTFHHHYCLLYCLRDLIEKDVATYCEIGTYHGGSLSLMLQHPKPIKVISVDPLHLSPQQENFVRQNIEKFNSHNYEIDVTKKFSYDKTLLKQFDETDMSIDILFIDGDHRYKPVIDDFINFSKYVAKGGFIVFDDYQDSVHSPQVKPAVDFIVADIKQNNLPYKIVGSLPNLHKIYPGNLPFLNEFILQKL